MASNFRCKYKYQYKSCLKEKVYIILFQSRVTSRHVCDIINFLIKVILSYLLNIVVLFSLRFVENMLNMS